MTAKVAMGKVRRERLWSLAILGLLIIGLTTWMIIPSMSESLQRGLSSYGNSVATYIFVYNTGLDGYLSRIPANISNQIVEIPGVQEDYPILVNWTNILGTNVELTFADGNRLDSSRTMVGYRSAVIGGQRGFPQSLIGLSGGTLPNDEAGFLYNGLDDALTLKQTYAVFFICPSQNNSAEVESSQTSIFLDREYVSFNATVTGTTIFNPILQQVYIMWNSTFLQKQLGPELYYQTFGGEGANFFIIKAADIRQVKEVASNLQSLFSSFPGYSVIYDQASVYAELSFQSQSGFLYELIGIMSFLSVASLIFLVTYVFSNRRGWEAGMLATQGWSWRRVNKMYFCYYFILGVVAIAISIPLSLFVGSNIMYSFQVYGNKLVIPVSIDPYLIISGAAISLMVSATASWFSVGRMKKTGLDNLLRKQ
jgi:ABC-type antimicrobial peptide transport system permease subunit